MAKRIRSMYLRWLPLVTSLMNSSVVEHTLSIKNVLAVRLRLRTALRNWNIAGPSAWCLKEIKLKNKWIKRLFCFFSNTGTYHPASPSGPGWENGQSVLWLFFGPFSVSGSVRWLEWERRWVWWSSFTLLAHEQFLFTFLRLWQVLCAITYKGVWRMLLSHLLRKLSSYYVIGRTRTEERALRSTLYRPWVLIEGVSYGWA